MIEGKEQNNNGIKSLTHADAIVGSNDQNYEERKSFLHVYVIAEGKRSESR